MSWSVIIFFLSLTFGGLSEGLDEKELPSAVVVGTVYCDTCFQRAFKETSHFISGASVAVECKGATSSKPSFRKEVKTDDHGEFKVLLPFSVSEHVKTIDGCSVKLIGSSEPNCAVASTATSSSLHLKSRKQGTHIFSAGLFTFKPQKRPDLCNQKPSIQNSKELGTGGSDFFRPPNPPSPPPPSLPFFPFPPIFPFPRPSPRPPYLPFSPFPPILPFPRPSPPPSSQPLFNFPPIFPPLHFPSIPGIPPVSSPKKTSP